MASICYLKNEDKLVDSIGRVSIGSTCIANLPPNVPFRSRHRRLRPKTLLCRISHRSKSANAPPLPLQKKTQNMGCMPRPPFLPYPRNTCLASFLVPCFPDLPRPWGGKNPRPTFVRRPFGHLPRAGNKRIYPHTRTPFLKMNI